MHSADTNNTEHVMAITDHRLIGLGNRIPTLNYCDQPYVVQADDGAWVCLVTTGTGEEGEPGQTIMALRSVDHGKSWSEPVLLEPADGPEASYAVALKTPGGRIYAFYNHNTDRVREIICDDGGTHKRVDCLGNYVFKYSDDHGRSWSEQRWSIPIRHFQIDRENPYGGDPIRYFWNVGRPFICADGSVYLPHTKVGSIGVGFYTRSEGVFLRSANILTERNPALIEWETLPDGDVGLRPPAEGGTIAEEHTIVELSDGTLYTVYRTVCGFPACAYSMDRGATWTPPERARYNPLDRAGKLFKHLRAANFVWKTRSGRYFYWFHNHGGAPEDGMGDDWVGYKAYCNRNPAWISAGHEVAGPDGRMRIVWSEPEILLYDDDPMVRISYPDLIEEDGSFWITETQKTVARVHRIDRRLTETILKQHKLCAFIEDDSLLLHAATASGQLAMPALPQFRIRELEPSLIHDTRKGFTLDFLLTGIAPDAPLWDAMRADGRGIRLGVDAQRRLQLAMGDGQQTSVATSDPLPQAERCHVSVVVDGGPRIVLFVVDGQLQDGGSQRQFGWQRFSPTLSTVNGLNNAVVSPCLSELRVYGRALLVSECVSNARAHAARA